MSTAWEASGMAASSSRRTDAASDIRSRLPVPQQRLDRTKPLWELWYVEGLAGGRTALISKTHHSLVDGISGVDLATVLFDLDPEPRAIEDADAWQPRPEPTGAELAAASVRSAAT